MPRWIVYEKPKNLDIAVSLLEKANPNAIKLFLDEKTVTLCAGYKN